MFLLKERRFIQKGEPLLRIRRRKIWLYLLCQIVGVALPVAISQTIAAIGTSTKLLQFYHSSLLVSQVRCWHGNPLTKLLLFRLSGTSLSSYSIQVATNAKVLSRERAGNHG